MELSWWGVFFAVKCMIFWTRFWEHQTNISFRYLCIYLRRDWNDIRQCACYV